MEFPAAPRSIRQHIPRPICVLLRGYPGVGKTTLARALAAKTGYVLLLKDDIRGPSLANDIRVKHEIDRAAGPSARALAALVDSNAACYHIMNAVAATQFSTGARGVILESPLGRQSVADDAVRVATAAGARCVLVDCVLDEEIWRGRLARRREASTASSDLTESHHHVAQSALPSDPQLILSHYPEGMQFHIDGCEASVRVDCALPVAECVEAVLYTLSLIVSA